MSIYKHSAAGEKKKLKKACERLAIPIVNEIENETGKKQVKILLNKLIPLGDAMVEAIFNLLPSPVVA